MLRRGVRPPRCSMLSSNATAVWVAPSAPGRPRRSNEGSSEEHKLSEAAVLDRRQAFAPWCSLCALPRRRRARGAWYTQ